MMTNRILIRTSVALAVAGAAVLGAAVHADSQGAPITHGVAAGDVTTDSAVIWSRTDRPAYMHVEIEGRRDERDDDRVVQVKAADDYTGKILLTGLRSDTDYEYRVWFSTERRGQSGRHNAAEGRFHTAPSSRRAKAVTFGWGGDVAGQNVCRDATDGFPIFRALNAASLDFFIGLGDMIYADGVCGATGLYGNAQVPGSFLLSATMADYWGHWRYNREDAGYRALLSSMPYYAIWDDHEVVNDFGPLHDTRTTPPYTPGVHLMPMGLKAMFDYNPILPSAATPDRLYRNIGWGKNMEMFILDTRQYRDANFVADSTASPKTLLGREQVVWLKAALQKSRATWKVIVSSVPMSIPTGSAGAAGRDGWANFQQTGGFENELTDVLRYMQQNGMYNVIWITTDVHFSEAFRYTPFSDDPSFQVHEVVTGPLNAGIFPNAAFDTSLGTESLFRFPTSAPANYGQAKQLFNFGLITIAENGVLSASINDASGRALYTLDLVPR